MVALCAAILAACSATSTPAIALDTTNPHQGVVTVTGLSRRDAAALTSVTLSRDAWGSVLRVSVKADAGPTPLAMAGRYDIRNGVIRFTPMVPFEPGRPYEVAFNPAALPGGGLAHLHAITSVVSLPAPPASPPTSVVAAYPSGPDVPANLLRMYVEFSSEMGIRTGESYIAILDGEGKEITGALLPLDTDLWNPEHTRFTILFDPGRVKRGILPNRATGRPLRAGQAFTLTVRRDWPDAQGRPLASDFRTTYRVVEAMERPLSPADWRIAAPAAGSRDPLVVTFPSSLDRGLLQRTLGVTRGAEPVAGEGRVEEAETRWTFLPHAAWQAGAHALIVQPELEDPAGNRVGRAFEARDPGDDTRQPAARIPFAVR